jgi:hypothetical protein
MGIFGKDKPDEDEEEITQPTPPPAETKKPAVKKVVKQEPVETKSLPVNGRVAQLGFYNEKR